MQDPIQSLFLASIRSASSASGLENASPEIKAELEAELERLAKQYGGQAGANMTDFPTFQFRDPDVDPINVSE